VSTLKVVNIQSPSASATQIGMTTTDITFSGTVNASVINLSIADTATAASHYIVETNSDGVLRPKTLADVRTELVTNTTVNSASATVLGTVTAGIWNASIISATYIDSAIARLASPALTGTPTSTTAAVDTNTTQIATTAYVVGQEYLKSSTASTTYALIASPTFTGTLTAPTVLLTTADTATAATHYFVETASDGVVRPKTLANVQTEIVTTAAVNAAAATTVGTLTAGTWNATNIALNRGGTNASLTAANGAVLYSTTSALALTAVGTSGQVLTSNGASAPTWQDASGGFEPFLLAGL